ncbi:MAG: DUF2125 domain-containing protein [Candidatus Paracaedibacteraceae bacterium]|nr:DUF2125 domain-containing protein [Candidatus Paracaedibacteraceae bacterium]
MRKFIYTVLSLVILLKISEIFIAQPWFNSKLIQALKDQSPALQMKEIDASGADLVIKHLAVAMAPDPIDIKGTTVVDLFGKPAVNVDLVPTGSQLWHVDRFMGRAELWFDSLSIKEGILSNVYVLDAPTMVIPRIEFSANHTIKENQTVVDIAVPQFAGGLSGAQLRIKGEVHHGADLSGKFTVTLVNPVAVVDFLKDAHVLKGKQVMMIKSFIGSESSQKSEITLPLNLEKGALYLGPIKLYPRSSKEETFARMIDSDAVSLFRSFGRVLQ